MTSPICGRCATTGCPGCSDDPCVGRFGCVWASAVVAGPQAARLSNAIQWYADIAMRMANQPAEARANHIRVVCLLALVLQACASDELWEWMMTNLRPCTEDPRHKIYVSTSGFGQRFAGAIPAPPPKTATAAAPKAEPGTFSSDWFSLGAGSPEAAREAQRRKEEWAHQLTDLLIRLQTNLFYIDETTIGIFKTPCQLEHSCHHNATVSSVGGDSLKATLVVRAADHIRRGERVSFCYLSDQGEAPLAVTYPLAQRRELIENQLGFVCRCSECRREERMQSAGWG